VGSRSRSRQLATRLGIADSVVFKGWLSSDTVLDTMRAATILVHPPITLDAMPTVIKEALAVGTPVVASDLAGIPEMLDHGACGVLVRPASVVALADAIGALLADPERQRALSQAGRRFAEEKFDLWNNGRALAERLHSTLVSGGERRTAP
jgi:glycosyltransferase involved in cell wall biosynthesis